MTGQQTVQNYLLRSFVFTKTVKTNARTEAEMTLLENNIIVYKFVQDLHFFVTGGDDENELWHQFFRVPSMQSPFC